MADAQNLDPAVNLDLDLAAFTRQLHSGLFVPEAEEATAPIDVVDRVAPASPMPLPRRAIPPAPADEATPPPRLPQPAAPERKPAPEQESTADAEDTARHRRPSTPDVPAAPAGPSGWQRAGHALADWVELHTQRRRTHRARAADADSDITIAALVVVSVVTITVAGLAFALSFSMMLAAAKLYGWSDNLAKLFPLLIDVGAIGGTFMGAISANRTYVRVGRSVLTLTLAASVLFNLVGHDVKGGSLIELPAAWRWTGTVAAVFIPIVLAYFVHAFSKALKAYMDQQREQRAAAAARAKAEADAAAADRARVKAEREKAALEAEKARQRQLQPAPVATAATSPAPRRRGPDGKVTKDEAVRIGVEKKVDTPAELKKALTAAGHALPASSTTVENWCRAIKDELGKRPAVAGRR